MEEETALKGSMPSTSGATTPPSTLERCKALNGKKKPSKSTNRMTWNSSSEQTLICETEYARPFSFKARTSERAKAWLQVAERMQRQGYRVDARAVRDHVTLLKTNLKAKNNFEKAATGIAVEETEQEKRIREAVEQMMQEEEDIELAPKEKGDEEKKRAIGSEMRKGALETFAETRKRHHSDSDASNTPRSFRNRGRETMAFLERRMQMDERLKKEEMDRKREEEERRRLEDEKRHDEDVLKEKRYEAMQQQMMQQQQHLIEQQQQNQQQNQQMLNMMMGLIKSLDKKN